MSTQLSKLHVRFIQSQTSFFLIKDTDQSQEKLPISQLYIKDNSNFYLVNENNALSQENQISILFKEKTHALESLQCKVSKTEINQGTEEYEDALMFFNLDTSKVKQLFLLDLSSFEEK